MNKLFRSIFTVVLAVFLLVSFANSPMARAADRENFSVTELTVLGHIGGSVFKMATKAISTGVNWTLNMAERLCLYLRVTGSTSGVTIIPPRVTGRLHIVRNAANAVIRVGISGLRPSGCGVTIASGATAVVIYDGTDWKRVTADVWTAF